MAELSRRRLLTTGGALGAVGALATAAPAWSWSPLGSVVGSGAGTDPRWVWDDEADPVVAAVLDSGDVPAVNALLRTWKTNDQPLPAGLPADLRDLMEKARQLPAWVDRGKLATAVRFNQLRGTYLGVTYGFASGMMSTAIPHEARAVYYSAGGADMKDRISKTAKLGYDVGSPNAFQPGGQMVVTCVKTRLVHAAVRHLLPQSPHWEGVADERVPISQRDLMVTWHSLPTTVMKQLRRWRVPIAPAHAAAFLHSWQVTGHLLGIRDEYLPATWTEANAQAAQVLDPVLAPTEEGVALADFLLDLGAEVDGGTFTRPFLGAFTRYTLGDQIADWLQIPREPGWDQAIKVGWPAFIRMRELGTILPGAPQLYWTFDEFIRRGALFYLAEGHPISIELPTGNNPDI
ncbi:oxygenase MpaB family protein [Nocardioides panacisoli]|uniref:Oxygenase MpaB family protein n=1 Tax=Nocardioides panacisoli TaxID=627624 RepID=A0ABP7IFP1_9ACTN